jgi:osmotically-inducible protein OsmY
MIKLKNLALCSTLALTATLPLITNMASASSTSVSSEAIAIDAAITSKIKHLYTESNLMKSSVIKITTINQNVVLSGQVKTKSQYQRAIILADRVDGVKAINADNLSIKASNEPLKDAYTTAKVKSTILKEKLFGSKAVEYWPVHVETKDSVVYLTGKVSSAAEKNNLIQVTKSVSGVSAVKSAIVIKQT